MTWLQPLSDNAGGGKAGQLFQLTQLDAPVPATWLVPAAAYVRQRGGDKTVLPTLRAELAAQVDPGKRYAVRSAANLEDGGRLSFAGMFTSHLDVQGVAAIVDCVEKVWQSAASPTVTAYLARHDLSPDALEMAVLIQEMVTPIVSGIAFSQNPLTGLDETIVEAVHGSGEALAQSGVTPARWVNKWGEWTERTDAADGFPPAMIDDVVHTTRRLAQAVGRPLDLEWVYDGAQVWWVQMRPITALEGLNIYSNRIAKEVMPGIIKPLVWSVNVPLVNGAWVKLFTEMIGPNEIDPLSLAKSFYGRSYFNMRVIGDIFELCGMPRASLELLMGIEGGAERPSFKPTRKTWRLLPRLLIFVARQMRTARRTDRFLTEVKAAYATFDYANADALDEAALLDEIERLYTVTQDAAYFNIVVPLLNGVYNRLLARRLRARGIDPAAFDIKSTVPEIRAIDPNYQAVQGMDEAAFIATFGHLSDSGNDFSVAPWREQPEVVRAFLEAARQRPAMATATAPDLGRTGPLFNFLYRRAQRFTYLREAISTTYTYGYGLFRAYFRALGRRLAGRGLVAAADDVFYLTRDEIRAAVLAGSDAAPLDERVAMRRAALEEVTGILPPETIYGDDALPVEALARSSADADRDTALHGVPTSRGYYRGTARVVRGLADFGRVVPGDVIVIPFSDVGWTPLFTRAGAVIAEAGGMLSHSSIVAREYGLPCVVSVPHAMERVPDGAPVAVDGFSGEITLLADTPEAT